jgi:hypothetical protein
VFQIRIKKDMEREQQCLPACHSDFEFVKTPSDADFVIQRIGQRADRIHRNSQASPQSHLFVRVKVAGVEATVQSLDLAGAAKWTGGNPTIAKSKIVGPYSAELASRRLR